MRRKRLVEGPGQRQPSQRFQQHGRELAIGDGDGMSPASDEDPRCHRLKVVAFVVGTENEIVGSTTIAHFDRRARHGLKGNQPRTHGAGEESREARPASGAVTVGREGCCNCSETSLGKPADGGQFTSMSSRPETVSPPAGLSLLLSPHVSAPFIHLRTDCQPKDIQLPHAPIVRDVCFLIRKAGRRTASRDGR